MKILKDPVRQLERCYDCAKAGGKNIGGVLSIHDCGTSDIRLDWPDDGKTYCSGYLVTLVALDIESIVSVDRDAVQRDVVRLKSEVRKHRQAIQKLTIEVVMGETGRAQLINQLNRANDEIKGLQSLLKEYKK